MTPDKVAKILLEVTSHYPAWFKQDGRAMKIVRGHWEDVLADTDYEKAKAAFTSWIATDTTGRPPTPGWIRIESRRGSKDGMSEGEIVALISKASRSGSYHAKEEFDNLPPICQKIVGSPDMLRVWAGVPSDKTETVVLSHIRKDYRNVKEEIEHISLIPEGAREVLGINQNSDVERLNFNFIQNQKLLSQ